MSAPIRRRVEPGIFERVGPDGTRRGLEVQWKDNQGIPRRRSVKGDIHAARDLLAEMRARRVHGEREPADPRMTLGAVMEHFTEDHVGDRPGTRLFYQGAFNRIRPVLGNKRVSDITRADVRRFVGMEVSQDLKGNTVRNHYSALRKLFSYANEDLELAVKFPALKPTDLPDPIEDQREHRILSDGELADLLAASDPRIRLYFRVLAETGCRASEGLGLVPKSIGDGTVQFLKQLGRDRTLRTLKTRQSYRTVEVTRGLCAELKLAGDRERTFPLLDHRDLEREWPAALDRAGIMDSRPVVHDLRHTHASKLIAAGWDVVTVAQRLGDSVETTMRVYAHEFDARRRSDERRAALEGLYPGKRETSPSEMATPMSTYTRLDATTDGSQTPYLRAVDDTR